MSTQNSLRVGTQVFDSQGRSGEVIQAFVDMEEGGYIYEVTGLGTLGDYEITLEAPAGVQLEPEPIVEVAEVVVEAGDPGGGFVDPEEIDIGTPRDISGYVAPPSGLSRSDVEAIVRSWVNLHRIEVNDALRALESDTEAIDQLTSDLDTLRDSISGLVIEQVRFRDREAEDLGALEEVEQTSLGGFIRNVGGFLLSPFDKIKDALEEYILGEVRDGLNR